MNRIVCVICLIATILSNHSYGQPDSLKSENEKHRFIIQLEAAMMFYESGATDHHNDFSISQVSSFRFGRWAQMGLGIGYEAFANFQAIPLFLQWQGDILNRKNGPYYYVRGGYTRMIDRNDNFDKINDGNFFSLGGGYAWQLEKLKLYVSLGYKRMNIETENVPEYYYWAFNFAEPSIETVNWKIQRIELKVGVSF